MNRVSDQDHSAAPGERFVDAALREHARNGGSDHDDELVHRILLETVNRPSRPIPARPDSLDWKSVAIGSTAVAALVALTVVVLSNFSFRSERASNEFHFVVRLVDTDDVAAENGEAGAAPPSVRPRRFEEPIDLVASTLELDTLESSAANDFQVVTAFGPSVDPFRAREVRHDRFRITADRVDEPENRMVYSGNVIVEHADFRIEADTVTVTRPDSRSGSSGSASAARGWTATGVRIEQASRKRAASADRLEFDPASGAFRLTGLGSFTTEEGDRRRFSSEDRLVLTREHYELVSAPTIKYANPRPRSPK
ncbi:MAG: LptA/OstA family protein [Verrucomicrobiales bacterium]